VVSTLNPKRGEVAWLRRTRSFLNQQSSKMEGRKRALEGLTGQLVDACGRLEWQRDSLEWRVAQWEGAYAQLAQEKLALHDATVAELGKADKAAAETAELLKAQVRLADLPAMFTPLLLGLHI